jgi:hypothetical protein
MEAETLPDRVSLGGREMSSQDRTAPDLPGYEPPRVERVLTPAELEREILYAGEDDVSGLL